eukprot:m.221478 g.221478  ORF g.221478 m.221478 type:complete len:445 (-) comp10595_c0_seq1:71-1405(-)
MGGQDLMLVVVIAFDIDVLRGKVIDLGGGHEADRDDHDGHQGKEQRLPKREGEEGPHVAEAENEHAAEEVLDRALAADGHHGDTAVVHVAAEHLQWLDEVHRKGADHPDGDPGGSLVLVQRAPAEGLGVALHLGVMVEIGVALGNVGVRMVADNVLVVPLEGRREPPANVRAENIQAPVAGESGVGGIVEEIHAEDPVDQGGGQESPELATEEGRERESEEQSEDDHLNPTTGSRLGGLEKRDTTTLGLSLEVRLDLLAELASKGADGRLSGRLGGLGLKLRPHKWHSLIAGIQRVGTGLVLEAVLGQEFLQHGAVREGMMALEERGGIAALAQGEHHRTAGMAELGNIVPHAVDAHGLHGGQRARGLMEKSPVTRRIAIRANIFCKPRRHVVERRFHRHALRAASDDRKGRKPGTEGCIGSISGEGSRVTWRGRHGGDVMQGE